MGTICLVFSPVLLSLSPQEGRRETLSLGECLWGTSKRIRAFWSLAWAEVFKGSAGEPAPETPSSACRRQHVQGAGSRAGAFRNLDRDPGSEPLKPNLLLSRP